MLDSAVRQIDFPAVQVSQSEFRLSSNAVRSSTLKENGIQSVQPVVHVILRQLMHG